jgi:hypothetical protein
VKKKHIEGAPAWGSWLHADDLTRGLEFVEGQRGTRSPSPVDREAQGETQTEATLGKERFPSPDVRPDVAPQNPGEPNLAKDPVRKEASYGKDSTDSRNLKMERLSKRGHDMSKSNLAGQDVEALYREKKRSRTSKPRHVDGPDTYKGGPPILNIEVPCK